MNARIVALEILNEGISNFFVSRNSWKKTSNLTKQDRAFVRRLVYGTLRYYFEIDKIIGTFLKDARKTPNDLKNILRMGTYELVGMKTPPYAVVNEYTSIAKPKFKGLVNAVLRRISEMSDELNLGSGLPKWLYEKLQRDLGDAFPIFLERNEFHEIHLRSVNKPRDEIIEDLKKHDIESYSTHFSPWGIRCAEGIDLDSFEQFENGNFTFQDESSQLVGIAVNPKSGEKILDAFGGVGTKTTHLVQIEPKAVVTYNDINKSKISIAMDNFKRLKKFPSKILTMDIMNSTLNEKFDKILVDAPCTALGTIGKHPDLLLRLTEKDIAEKAQMQLKMLEKLWGYLSEEGEIIYSVCTVTKEETDDVISTFIHNHSDAVCVDPFDGKMNFEFGGLGIQLLKWMEGFYISKIVKKQHMANTGIRH